MNREELVFLFRRYLSNQCTKEEVALLLKYFKQADDVSLSELIHKELEQIGDEFSAASGEEEVLLERIHNHVKEVITGKNKSRHSFQKFSVAAAIILLIGTGIVWRMSARSRMKHSSVLNNNVAVQVKDIIPGHAGATLRLSNGSAIMLDSAQNGTLATQGNTRIIKKNGQIEYCGASSEVVYNTITTDRGREWKIVLPDGTTAWLNAESSITYPTAFTGATRTVEVSGEVYFDVIHNAAKPFQVKVENQLIEDIGTEFDVKAYTDEHIIKTTLVKGSVRVTKNNQSLLLKPGQQAVTAQKIDLRNNVNVNEEIAWKNGYFLFQNTDLKEIMRQIGRWYNVSVEYKGNIKPDLFTGRIPRTMLGSEVLNILQEAGVHFNIEATPQDGREGKIIVTP